MDSNGAQFVDLEEALVLQYFAVVADITGGIVREFPAEDREGEAHRVSPAEGTPDLAKEGIVGLHGRLCLQAISGQQAAVDASLRIMERAVMEDLLLVPDELTMTAGSREPEGERPSSPQRPCNESSLT